MLGHSLHLKILVGKIKVDAAVVFSFSPSP